MSEKGLLVVLSGPSGAGKDTVLKRLMEKEPGIRNPFGAACGPLRTSPERGGSGACGRLPNGPGARISLRYTHILYFTTAHRVCKRFLQKKAGDFAA